MSEHIPDEGVAFQDYTPKLLHCNATTRVFAESGGRCLAFGQDIVSCDVFLNPVSYGYFFFERGTRTERLNLAGGFEAWHELILRGQALATEFNVDPSSYGVQIHRVAPHSDHFTGYLVRVARIESDIREIHKKAQTDQRIYRITGGREYLLDPTKESDL
tara:strand:- start:172 stop:651 length:480 start_codon:yes stop_codon:yes gene_type:complete